MDSGHLNNQYLPWATTAVAIAYAIYLTLKSRSDTKSDGNQCVNHLVKKDCDKVVDSVDIEDIGTKAVFCRCWKSNKFPYCDGTHNDHNKSCGDNVGPLIIQKKTN